jgi:hypothetical protein
MDAVVAVLALVLVEIIILVAGPAAVPNLAGAYTSGKDSWQQHPLRKSRDSFAGISTVLRRSES